jgi:hypothetical protein
VVACDDRAICVPGNYWLSLAEALKRSSYGGHIADAWVSWQRL